MTVYVTGIVNFGTKIPTRVKNSAMNKGEIYATLGAGMLAVLTVILDVCAIFPNLQDPESGEFVFTHISQTNFIFVSIVTAVGILGTAALTVYALIQKKKARS